MKKLTMITLALVLMVGMLIAQTATTPNPKAVPGPKVNDNPNLKDRPMPVMEHENIMMKLNLSEAQKTNLQNLRNDFQKRMNTLKAEIENLEIDIRAALKAEKYQDAKNLTKQMQDKKLSMAYAKIDHMQAMLKELTKEQKDMARDMFMPGMMGKGMRGGPMMPGMGRGMEMGFGDHGFMMQGPGMGCGKHRPMMQGSRKDCGEHGDKMHGQNKDKGDCGDCSDKKADPKHNSSTPCQQMKK